MRYAVRMVGNIFVTAIFISLAGVSLELVARVADGLRAASGGNVAPTPLSKEKMDQLIRNLVTAFDGEFTYEQILKDFLLMYQQLKYKPWIQIGNADHKNPYSIVVDGVRKTLDSTTCRVPSVNEENAGAKPKVVWFYGGSTMYGLGVPWWDTIPSKFVDEANQNGACVIAVNFGVPFHFSRQEAIYFVSNLMKERAPDAVIFLDGLNDLVFPGSSIRSEPYFTPRLERFVPPTGNATMDRTVPSFMSRLSSFVGNLHMLRWLGLSPGTQLPNGEETVAYSNEEPPKEFLTDEQVAHAVVDRYVITRNFISKICESYETKCFQFLQPVAAVDYIPQEGEIVTIEAREPSNHTKLLLAGYPLMKEIFKSRDARCGAMQKGLEYADFSSIFRTYEGIPYVDYAHYAPRANKLIATEMFRCVFAKP